MQRYIKDKKARILIKNFNQKYNRIKKLEISENYYLNFIKKKGNKKL